MSNKETAIIYIRVSTNEQVDGFSLDNQRRECVEYCNKNNIDIVTVLADEGISGKDIDKREGIKEALQKIKNGGINYLIVWKLSRLSRSLTDIASISNLLDKSGANLISIKDSIDTKNGMGRQFLYMAGIFAEVERENIITQVKAGMKQKALCGEWNGGAAPLGYKLVEKRLIIDEDESKIVEYIFNNYLSNKGYRTIAEELNTRGHKTRKNKLFTGNGVKDILMNPIYIGKLRWGYRVDCSKTNFDGKRNRKYNDSPVIADGLHEAIIDGVVFNKVQNMIKNNPRHHVKQFNGGHILSGLLKCPQCGSSMSVQIIGTKAKQYKYYSCNAYANHKICRANQIKKESIEEEFLNLLNHIVNENEFKDKMMKAFNGIDDRVYEIENLIKKKEKEVDLIKSRRHKLVLRLVDNKDDKVDISESIEDSIERLNEEIKDINDKIEDNRIKINELISNNINKNDMVSLINNMGFVMKLMDKEAQKKLIRSLVKKIIVGEDKHIKEIHFCFNEKFIIEGGTVNRTISKPLNL